MAIKQRQEQEKIARMEAWLAGSNFGAKDAEIKEQIRRIYELDILAKQATPYVNENPMEGDFKRDASGKLFRFTNLYWKKIEPTASNYNASRAENAPEKVANPAVGDYKKIKGKIFRWTNEPAFLQVDRKTNFDIDLADTFTRYDSLGRPYLNARDQLWGMIYPDEAPIYRPAAYRRRSTRRTVNTRRRRNRRKTNSRK